jgi:hypothetical protein
MALALIGALAAEGPLEPARAQIGQVGQVGQGAMGPVGGFANRAMGRLANLNENGPGVMYYGINAADRGLGYRGSYFTVGSFIPYAEDDLGGVWSADLRTHLSNYAGFFSNVGAVRKQFVGGTIMGLGIYWDYDSDQGQYSPTTITDSSGSYVFAGGQTYNQVGISGEWLTDYGNLRSNGYIPVGTTAQTMGPFVGNSFLCNYGINAALAGADLEVGAWIPGLADWAGMVSVGGYAFGNARYNLADGRDVVPYFGGVFTRLDLTLVRNWDFSLQANNDSFFDWTGFARLTYRMGGSRRRNVPDQMEQPMFRNEHIVRAHQAPEQAINAATGLPYQVYHVDNSATTLPAGNGTSENPFTTLQQASAAATAQHDIVFVHVGQSETCPYDTSSTGGYQFQADNQYLVGEGTTLQLCTANCGYVPLWGTGNPGRYPVITNPSGAAIVADKNGTYIDHLQIVGSRIGITDCDGLAMGSAVPCVGSGTEDAPAVVTVNDVRIIGTGPSQTGVLIRDLAGNSGVFNFSNMYLKDLTQDGFVLDGQVDTGSGFVSGTSSPAMNITNSQILDTQGAAVLVNATNGVARITNSMIEKATDAAVVVTGGNALVDRVTIRNPNNYGVSVSGTPILSGSAAPPGTSTVQVSRSTITANIGVLATAPNTGDVVNVTVNGNTLLSPGGGNGVSLAVASGTLNANVNSNNIAGTPTTFIPPGATTATTGSSAVANILLTTATVTGTVSNAQNLTIKAASQNNLRAINNNATVFTVPVQSATVPPPPNYDPAVIVPIP